MHKAYSGRRSLAFSGARTAPTAAATRLAKLNFLSDEEQAALADTALQSRSLRAGEELVREGEPAAAIHFMSDGWACRFKLTRDGRRQISTLLAPGDIGNIDTLLFDRPDYGVRMLTTGTILSLPRERALALVADHPGIARAFTRLGFVENAILAQWAFCLGRQSAQERVAHLLCEMAARLGHADTAGAVGFELPLTQEHLADVLGLTPVHVNRTLQQLRGDGLLASTVRRIEVRDIAALRRLAGFSPTYLHLDDFDAAALAVPDRFDAARVRLATVALHPRRPRAGTLPVAPVPPRTTAQGDDLLLRETNHRCSNDLQLVVSLLALQSRRAARPEAREALADAMERVAILARARSTLQHQAEHSLEAALRQICEALQSQAEPRGIRVSLDVGRSPEGLPSSAIMAVALAVNELATNAIKHAFEEGKTGHVRIALRQPDDRQVVVTVDEDGLPFAGATDGKGTGLGLDLVKRLIASIGGLISVPTGSAKIFELHIPTPA